MTVQPRRTSVPRAVVDRRALAANLALLSRAEPLDLRNDAWGHGVLTVAEVAAAAGREVLVDDEGARLLDDSAIPFLVGPAPTADPRALYGLPGDDGGLRGTPAMRLIGRVLSTKPLLAGEAVSYGYTFRAERDTVLALVTGGYAHGIVRALGNRASVEIDGTRRRIVGRVAMDVCVVDLAGGSAADGAEVVYFGGSGGAAGNLADWARITGLGAAELLVVAASKAEREVRG